MDPLSLAASVAGLVSLGLQVTGGISTYLDALKCRDEELEAIRRQNAALRSTITAIETTTSAIQTLPLHATTAAAEGIKSCTNDLGVLEALVAQLSGSDLSTWRLQVKDKSRRLHYAFDRPKITQLHTRIDHSKATLQLVIAELNLATSCLNTENLSLIDSSLRDNATDLLLVRSEVAATHGPVMEIRQRLPDLQAKVAGLQPQLESHYGMVTERISESTATTSQKMDHVQHTIEASFGLQKGFLERFDDIQRSLQMLYAAYERSQSVPGDAQSFGKAAAYLAAKPAELQAVCRSYASHNESQLAGPRSDHSQPLWLTNARSHGSLFNMKPPSGGKYRSCICHKKRQQKLAYSQFGSFFMYYQQTNESHSPDCPMSRVMPSTQQRKYGFRIAGLKNIVKAAIDISFAASFGAGGWSISPHFAYKPTVDTDMDPAFRVLGCVREVLTQYARKDLPPFYSALEHKALCIILQLFSEGKSSPLAVDSKNRTLMHHALGAVDYSPLTYPPLRPFIPPPSHKFIVDLLSTSVPAMSHDIYGNCPAPTKSDMMISLFFPRSIECLQILLEAEGGATPITTSGKYTLARWGDYCLGSTTDITEGILSFLNTILREAYGSIPIASGSGPLIMAVKTNNRERVLSLITEHPDSVKERNHCGDNAIFIAAFENSLPSFPELLKAAKAVLSLDKNAIDIDVVLGIAIKSTSQHCVNKEYAIECSQCICSDSFSLLLENLAEFFPPLNSVSTFWNLKHASQRCRRLYICHLKFQRESLKDIGISNSWALRGFQHLPTNSHVLDLHARRVSTLLQQHGVHVPAHLVPSYMPCHHLTRDTSIAELLFEMGFRDIDYDSSYRTPPLTRHLDPHLTLWYLEHGANPTWRIKLPGMINGEDRWNTSAHHVMHNVGLWVHRTGGRGSQADLEALPMITLAIHSVPLANCCSCACSTGGCAPFRCYLTRIPFFETDYDSHKLFQNLPLEEARALYIVVIRFETFRALGLTHTCCHINSSFPPTLEWDPHRVMDEEDILEIQEEESDLLVTLDSIVDEFETRLKNVDGGLDELQDCSYNYWQSRIPAILEDLRRKNMTEEERREAEVIGVKWEDDDDEDASQQHGNVERDVGWTEDNWEYKLHLATLAI